MTPLPQSVVLLTSPLGCLHAGLYRILHVPHEENWIWLIPIPNVTGVASITSVDSCIDGGDDPVPETENGDRNQTPSRLPTYIKGYRKLPLQRFEKAVTANQVVPASFTGPPIWSASDDDIAALWCGGNLVRAQRMLGAREHRWSWISAFVTSTPIQDALEQGLVAQFVKTQATAKGVSKVSIYSALFLYWSSGSVKNSLLGGTWRCGGYGKKKRLRGKKVGPRNAAVRAGDEDKAGFIMTPSAIKRLQHGWTLVRRETVHSAYLITMGAFWSEATAKDDGTTEITLLPPHRRPTERQFSYWGPKDKERGQASLARFSDKDWALNHRGLKGSARDGIERVGQRGACDTSTNDCYLVRVTSRLLPCGFVNRLLIWDTASGAIAGLHAGYEAPSSETFLQAVLNAASDKVEFCARYGREITADEWFPYAARIFVGDNGEYNVERSREALDQYGSAIRTIPTGRADLNPIAESGHHKLHAQLDHRLDGTTKGRTRRRGEQHPALLSVWNFYDYMHELIGACLWINNVEDISTRVPTEAREDLRNRGSRITRLTYHRWLIENGYVATTAPNVELLRAHCLPRMKAVLHENGVRLLRPDTGDRRVEVPGLRFYAPYLEAEGLLTLARRKGPIDVIVAGSASDLSHIWLCTGRQGMQKLVNASQDPILVNEATLTDCLLEHDAQKLATFNGAAERQQLELEREEGRARRQSRVRRLKQGEIDALPAPPRKSAVVRGIAANTRDEIDYLKRQMPASEARAGQEPPASRSGRTAGSRWDPDEVARTVLRGAATFEGESQ